MLWFPEWRVLVVDDEPDVQRLTDLALRNMEVEGVPVRLFMAGSKAEAIDVLNTQLADPMGLGLNLFTVALIDVVMETDTAGLELCDYIRNSLNNSVVQLYIRTGQPGLAPERAVIDQYDITGYFTKVEATEDKLYTLIKSASRQYVFSAMALENLLAMQASIRSASYSQEQISTDMNQMGAMLIEQRNAQGNGTAVWVDDTLIMVAGYSGEEAAARRDQLLGRPARQLSPMGETVIVDREVADGEIHDGLIQVPAGPDTPAVTLITSGNFVPRSHLVSLLSAWSLRSIGMLWQMTGRVYAP